MRPLTNDEIKGIWMSEKTARDACEVLQSHGITGMEIYWAVGLTPARRFLYWLMRDAEKALIAFDKAKKKQNKPKKKWWKLKNTKEGME